MSTSGRLPYYQRLQIAAYFQAVLPDQKGRPVGRRHLETLVHQLETYRTYTHPVLARLLPLLIAFLEWSPLILAMGLRPLSKLPLNRRRQTIQRLLHHRIRLVGLLAERIKGFAALFYYSTPWVYHSIGYRPGLCAGHSLPHSPTDVTPLPPPLRRSA